MSSQTAISNHQSFCTISAVPDALFRAFEAEDHGRQFLSGELRFGLLQSYRKMEGSRRDETEGRASIRWDLKAENPSLNNVTYSGTSLNLYYALCTLAPAGQSHLSDFGSFALQIKRPLVLLKRICDAWKDDARASGEAFIVPVVYNKNELEMPPPYFIAPLCLVYAQKPAKYSDEAEYRYVVSCKVGTREEPFLSLRVGRCDDICSTLFKL